MKAGVLLSGCGFLDGSEIHEAVFCMHSLQKYGFEVVPLSVQDKQAQVVNHISGDAVSQHRNVMEESARIARGKISSLKDYDLTSLDMLVLPGGAGCITSLSDFAEKSQDLKVHPQVEKAIEFFHGAKKPIAAVCIAPVLLAKVLGKHEPILTVGNNDQVEKTLSALGARMKKCPRADAIFDSENNLASSPAYMYDDSTLVEVEQGIDKMIEGLLKAKVEVF